MNHLRDYRDKLHELSHARIAYDAYSPGEGLTKFGLMENSEKRRWLSVYNACVFHFLNCSKKSTDMFIEDLEEV